MLKPIRLAGKVVFCTLAVTLLASGRFGSAGTRLEYPHHSGSVCVPNAKHFGHFQTTWRSWPGGPPQAVAFPQSIGGETIATPKAEKQPILPRSRVPGGPGGAFPPGGFQPGVPPAEGGFPLNGIGAPPVPDVPQIEPSLDPFPPGGPLETPAEPGLPAADPSLPPTGPSALPADPAQPPALPANPAEEPLPPPSSSSGKADSPKLVTQTALQWPRPAAGQQDRPQPLQEPEPLPFSAGAELQAVVPSDNAGGALPEPVPEPYCADSQRLQVPPLIAPQEAMAAEAPKPLAPKLAAQPVVEDAAEPTEPDRLQIAQGEASKQPKTEPLRANWMAALHPGFQGDAGLRRSEYPSAPARQVAHQAAVGPQHTTIDRKLQPQQPDRQPTGLDRQPSGNARSVPTADSPPVALDGFCPVELLDNERWAPGEAVLTAVYQRRTYVFSGEAQRQRFLKDPQRYTPRFSGHDPVLAVDGGRRVVGQTDYCVTYDGRLYMFSSSVTLSRFRLNPQPYAAAAEGR